MLREIKKTKKYFQAPNIMGGNKQKVAPKVHQEPKLNDNNKPEIGQGQYLL